MTKQELKDIFRREFHYTRMVREDNSSLIFTIDKEKLYRDFEFYYEQLIKGIKISNVQFAYFHHIEVEENLESNCLNINATLCMRIGNYLICEVPIFLCIYKTYYKKRVWEA